MTHGHEVEEEGRWGPHFRIGTNKKKENKEKGKEESGGKFPHLIKSVSRIKRKERKGKRKKRENKEEKKEEEGAVREKKESGVRSSIFSLRSTEIEPSVSVGARGKVHISD